ncbi:MAG: pyruvate ferredoxin oxidoreductase, partial [Armatimonadetes bacterium]|nr:pyruvate ferredoxin oxidoreductase [Armatimonadota bacterium]
MSMETVPKGPISWPGTDKVIVMEGSHAASYAAKLARVQVISAYPITPQTGVVEKLSEMCASGELPARFIKVESEHSAMAACVGAQAAGARTFTATSSQGLALMHEMLHWAAGGRLPVVLLNVNRSMGPPWTIYCDQNDSLSQRDTGWLQIYCESNQEVLDSVLHAFRVGEQTLMPCMVNLDAFFLSHTTEPVAVPSQALVDEYLPPYDPPYKLDPSEPHTFGGLARPDTYMELRYKMHLAQEEAKGLFKKADEEYGKLFGRTYGGLVDTYRMDGAEVALVTAGTAASTSRIVVDDYRARGIKLGLIRIRVFRPFPAEDLLDLIRPLKK